MKWETRLKLKRASKFVIAICAALLLFFTGFTIYGREVGNFVINLQDSKVLLALSMKEDLSDASSQISLKGMERQTNATYSYIPQDIAKSEVGNKSDTNSFHYFAVSFYLLNISDEDVGYSYKVSLIDQVGNAVSALRVMIIKGDRLNADGDVYALAETSLKSKTDLETWTSYSTIDFIADNGDLFREDVLNFKAGEKKKYTVVMWLEGYDADCNDSIIGSRLRMQMTFTAI